MTVLFAISVPVSRFTPHLERTLTSLVTQEVPLEIAVLDCSDDQRTRALVERFGNAISYARHGWDDGQTEAIEEGWAVTHAPILGWLNADDFLYPGALAKVAEGFSSAPGVDAVYGDGAFFDAGGRFLGYFPHSRQDLSDIRFNNLVPQPSSFVRRAAIDAVGGLNRALHFTMDWDLWLRLWQGGYRFRHVPEIISGTTISVGTKTARFSLRRYRELFQILHRSCRSRSALRLVMKSIRHHCWELTPLGRLTARQAQLARLRRLQQGGAPSGNSERRTILGLDSRWNLVGRACTVRMPVPVEARELAVDLEVLYVDRRREPPGLRLNGCSLTARPEAVPGTRRAVRWSYALENPGLPVLDFEIEAARAPFVLRRVGVSANGVDHAGR